MICKYTTTRRTFGEKFDPYVYPNMFLDIPIELKGAIMEASAAVVSLSPYHEGRYMINIPHCFYDLLGCSICCPSHRLRLFLNYPSIILQY